MLIITGCANTTTKSLFVVKCCYGLYNAMMHTCRLQTNY